MGLIVGKFFQHEDVNFIHRYEFSGGKVIYHGWAAPGTPDSTAKWCIVKYTYDVDDLVAIDHPKDAAGTQTNAPVFSWQGRAGYTYSA
jgi:hypothetical protein